MEGGEMGGKEGGERNIILGYYLVSLYMQHGEARIH